MLKNEFLRVGQEFRGLINGEEFQIIDITKGLRQEPYKVQQSPTQKDTTYIYIKDSKGRTSHTNAQTFNRLQIEPIKGGK